MALKRNERYPGRFTNPSTEHPQGAFQDRTSPTAQDGSYFQADWANDWSGFFERVLAVAGVTPNGNIDDATSSQYYDALLKAMPGRLIATRTFTTSGSYTPTAGTRYIRLIATAGGGGGGGVPTTSSTQTGGAQAGFYGQAAELIIPVTAFNAPVSFTIGAGGAGGTAGANAGVAGGNTTFGNILVLGGGPGGAAGVVGTASLITGAGGSFATFTSTITPVWSSGGITSSAQYMQVTAGTATGFSSLPSVFPGGFKGRGGDSKYSGSSQSAVSGNNGRDGYMIIEEYS